MIGEAVVSAGESYGSGEGNQTGIASLDRAAIMALT
jgi:hypothetical protein